MQNIIATMLAVIVTLVLIIGGIEYYNKSQSTAKASDAVGQITTIISGIDSLYQGQSQFSSITTTGLIAAKVFPDRMVGSSGSSVTDPWGADVTVTPGASGDTFDVTYNGVPSGACARIAGVTSGSIVGVSINGASQTLPVDPITAATACSQTGSGSSGGNVVAYTAN
jgi:major structural subunit of bundle-forming pilus